MFIFGLVIAEFDSLFIYGEWEHIQWDIKKVIVVLGVGKPRTDETPKTFFG